MIRPASTWDDILPTASYLPTSRRMTFPEWLRRSEIILDSRPYSLAKHEYLEAIIADTHPQICFEKAAQVGISTTILLKSLWVAEHLAKKVIYYFQNDGAVSDFSNDRAQPIIDESPYLSARVRSTQNVQLKQIGPGSLYFRGLLTKGKVKSVDADAIVLDELDEAPPENVKFATDRLLHSDLHWITALSQPSIPGWGIDKQFAESDQHYWHLICPACNKKQCLELDWPQNFIPVPEKLKRSFPDGATHYRGCRFCGRELNMAKGVWVARFPARRNRGYHLSQLFSQICPPVWPNVATRIMYTYEQSRRSQIDLKNFTISVLGWPFAGGMARVTDELLDFCESDYGFSHQEFGAFMGVDQGDVLTIAIGIIAGHQFKWVYFDETENWDRLDVLMDRFGVQHCVIDAQPNKHPAKSFAARWPERTTIQYFSSRATKKGLEPLEGRVDIATVTVDRTETLDRMIDRMENGQATLPSRRKVEGHALTTLENVRRHCKNLVARDEASASGTLRRVYLGGNIENHYGFAMNSSLIAAYELGVQDPGPMVLPIFAKMGHA